MSRSLHHNLQRSCITFVECSNCYLQGARGVRRVFPGCCSSSGLLRSAARGGLVRRWRRLAGAVLVLAAPLLRDYRESVGRKVRDALRALLRQPLLRGGEALRSRGGGKASSAAAPRRMTRATRRDATRLDSEQRACVFVVCLFVCLLVCLFVCLFVCLLACLLVCLFVCLFVCVLFVELFWAAHPCIPTPPPLRAGAVSTSSGAVAVSQICLFS